MSKLNLEPVRLYAIASAVVALAVNYVPSLPDVLILGLVSALLGLGGVTVRKAVTPNRTVESKVLKAYVRGAQNTAVAYRKQQEAK